MKLRLAQFPVKNLKEAQEFYRRDFGWEAAWRVGDDEAGLRLPGAEVELLLDQTPGVLPGPIFMVESVDAFYRERRSRLCFLREPHDIPSGRHAVVADPSGNAIHVIDMSRQPADPGRVAR